MPRGLLGGFAAVCWVLCPSTLHANEVVEDEHQPNDELLSAESVSCGSTNRGALSNAAELPITGPGFVVSEPWRSRDTRFGTKELVSLVSRTAGAVNAQYPDSQLGVGDLSLRHGGPIRAHRSHQNGRDVDLIYYALDANSEPFAPDNHMATYNARGRSTLAQAPEFAKHIPERFFDLQRNWALVRALTLDEETPVSRIFVSARVERWLMRYATKINENEDVIKKARRILHQHADPKSHNDHLHVRIACSEDDVLLGRCRDHSAAPPRQARRWYRRVRCPRPLPNRHLASRS